MILEVITYIFIILLIYTNAITDAPNAISTVVGTKVMDFKKAAILSAAFDLAGVIVLSFFNLSVANCITSMVDLSSKSEGLCVVLSGIVSVIVFSNIALKFGIPTSETHSLIAGLTGALIAYKGIMNINFWEWRNVVIGLIISITGTLVITTMLVKLFRNLLYKLQSRTIKSLQIFTSMGVSFTHGAQDGQKFIGILIVFHCLVNNTNIPTDVNSIDYIGIIVLTAICMFVGISIGGKKIVDTLGTELTTIKNEDALVSDFVTMIILFVASLNGLPISTSHVKTVSIVASSEKMNSINIKKLLNIAKVWIYTFPVCGILSYAIMKILIKLILI